MEQACGFDTVLAGDNFKNSQKEANIFWQNSELTSRSSLSW